jgi:hypothetical protein
MRKDVAKDLKVHRTTLLKYDQLLALTIPSYRTARIGDRQPLTYYQVWAIKKLRQLIHRGIKGSALKQYLRKNNNQLNYEAYQNEITRISQENRQK